MNMNPQPSNHPQITLMMPDPMPEPSHPHALYVGRMGEGEGVITMNTIEVSFSEYLPTLERLRREGKRASVIIHQRNGYKLVTTNMQQHQQELLQSNNKQSHDKP